MRNLSKNTNLFFSLLIVIDLYIWINNFLVLTLSKFNIVQNNDSEIINNLGWAIGTLFFVAFVFNLVEFFSKK